MYKTCRTLNNLGNFVETLYDFYLPLILSALLGGDSLTPLSKDSVCLLVDAPLADINPSLMLTGSTFGLAPIHFSIDFIHY